MDLGGSELGSTGGRRRYAAQGAEEEGGEAEGRWGLGGPLGGAALAASWGAPGASLVGDWGLWVAARTGEWGGREGMNETLEIIYIYRGSRVRMSTDLRVWILNFETRYKIPVGFRVIPAPVPAGTNPDPNPRPAGRVSAGTRVFYTRCHL